MDIALILINSGYLLGFIALAIKEVLWLRVVLTLSQSLIFINNIFFSSSEFANNIAFWNFIFVIINIIQIIRIHQDRKPKLIPAELRDLYEDVFHEFTSKEFLYFLGLGGRFKSNNEKIISSGENQDALMLILDGCAEVKRGEKKIASLQRGQFIAEISFLTNQPASADVYASDLLIYIKWSQPEIKIIKETNNLFWTKLLSVLANDVTTKIRN